MLHTQISGLSSAHLNEIGTFRSQSNIPAYLSIVPNNSMLPTLQTGSFALCKQLIRVDVIEFGQIHKIVLHDGRTFYRRIKKHRYNNSVVLCADNPNYDSFSVHKNLIAEIWTIEREYRFTTVHD